MKTTYVLIVFVNLFLFSCNDKNEVMKYKVEKISEVIQLDANWNKEPWNKIEPLTITHYMGEKPEHFPHTQAKVAYDDEAIYVIFRVNDRFVRVVTTKNHGPVFQDSCVEFFFSPDGDPGYFNLEMNAGGTMLLHHQNEPRKGTPLDAESLKKVEVAHSLPEYVDPEIKDPVDWTVEYRIPFSVLKKYADVAVPQAGTVWRANFYKCADETSHPHWLTWAPVDKPQPDFHLPEYFGEIVF